MITLSLKNYRLQKMKIFPTHLSMIKSSSNYQWKKLRKERRKKLHEFAHAN
jgi:hypothetical protein